VEASSSLAFLALASPSAFSVPMAPTLRMWTGNLEKSRGLAGDAKW